MPYLAFIARLYVGIEATSCQAGRMMLIRLNRHLVDEVRELDAAVEQARAKASKSAQKSVDAQEERANKSIDLSL